MLELELAQPLPAVSAGDRDGGERYGAASCLVRLHGRPLGIARFPLPPAGLSAAGVGDRIGEQLGPRIRPYLREEQAALATRIPPEGLKSVPEGTDKVESTPRPAPAVSVVIPTLGRPRPLRAAVESVLACDYPPERRELIVVDNGPGGNRVGEALEAVEGDGVRVVREGTPGAARARNRGLDEARGEIVAFADDDVVVDRDWLAAFVRAFSLTPSASLVAGVTLARALETQVQMWLEAFAGLDRGFEPRSYELECPPENQPLFPFGVGEFGSGPSLAVRREAFLEEGGFDPCFGPPTPTLTGEDIEATLRLLLRGHRIRYEPAAIVWHEHPRELDALEQRAFAYGVGLTACLTKALVQHPRLLPALVRRLPKGIAYAIRGKSSRGSGEGRSFPSKLTRLELLGMAYGPFAYARSRRRVRRWKAATGSPVR